MPLYVDRADYQRYPLVSAETQTTLYVCANVCSRTPSDYMPYHYTSLNLYPTSLHPYTFTNLYTPLTLSLYYHKLPWHYHKSLHPYTHTTTKQTWIDTALVRHNYNSYSRLPPPPSCNSLVSFSLAHTRIYIVSPPVPLYPPSFYLSLSLSLSLSRPPPFPCLNF